MVNAMFMRPGARLVELGKYDTHQHWMERSRFAEMFGMEFTYVHRTWKKLGDREAR